MCISQTSYVLIKEMNVERGRLCLHVHNTIGVSIGNQPDRLVNRSIMVVADKSITASLGLFQPSHLSPVIGSWEPCCHCIKRRVGVNMSSRKHYNNWIIKDRRLSSNLHSRCRIQCITDLDGRVLFTKCVSSKRRSNSYFWQTALRCR